MTKSSVHQVEFAKRHLVSEISTFDAASAIYRLKDLLLDLGNVASLLKPDLAPTYFEFVSYYKIGFVTCLEWHAKSRLYDLFVHDPKTIESGDISKGLSDSNLKQMIVEGLTVPQLLAGARNISTKESYVTTMDRVLKGLGSKNELSGIIADTGADGVTNGELLDRLFTERNGLVHEISLSDIGHRNIRYYTSFDEALDTGTRVLNVIEKIEALITKHAKGEFPNLLDLNGYPIDEEHNLVGKLNELERKIDSAIAQGNSIDGITVAKWRRMMKRRKTLFEAEFAFIDGLDIPGIRYFNVRPFLKKTLLKQGLKYLELIAKEIAG